MNQEITFGQFIKEHRKKLDLTQAELARRVGCATITLRKIESDTLRPSVQIAERLAMTLNIPLEERADFIRLARHQFLKKLTPPKMPTPPPEPREIGGEDLSGRSVRGYQLGELIGSGGFGAVYRAVQPVVEREVAIKIILPEYADHPDFIRRFEAEAQLVARLEHPYIVPLYDYWREPSAAYLVLRLLRGGSLESVIKKGPVPLEFTMRIMGQIGRALQTAHRYGVIHRDIKPANIMLDEEENVYLTDFGIAKNLGNPNLENQTEIGAMIGTPSYMSPEQIRSESIMPQADIYSLGVLLYELLTGKLPFQGITPIDMIMLHLSEPLPSVLTQNASLPSTLDPVIQKATAKDPAERYPDVITMLAELHTATGYATDSIITSSKPIEKLLDSDPALIENPYKGLRPFSEADADHFHGRGTLVQELLSKLSEEDDLSRFLAVVGPSGSGKSSTVKAGLIPALRRGGLPGSDNWFIVDLIPGPHPFEELEAALLRVAVNPPESLLSQLKEDQSGLRRAVNRILPPDEDIELVLVIDQFEEVFTLMEDEEMRALFLDNLISAVLDERSRVRIIVTIRADFTDRPLSYVDFGELMRSRSIFVLPLNADELEEAITRPASHVGLVIDPGLVAQIVREVGDQPGSLPLLQYVLTEMFERREGRQITSDVYQDSGGVFGALGRRAEALYQELDRRQQQTARQLFMRLVTLGEGVEDTRRRVQVTEFSGMDEHIQGIIDQFVKYRLLTSDRDPVTRTPTIEVAHEALIREWESLRKWIAKSREDIRNQRILLSASAAWNDANKDVSFLLRGARLSHYEDWLQNTTITLNEQEQSFLNASLEQRKVEEQQEAERQARERTLEKRSKNVLRWLAGVLLVAAVVSGIFAIQANSAEGEALRQAGIASTAAADAQQQAELAAAAAADAKVEAEARAIQQAIAQSRELAAAALNTHDAELSALLALEGLKLAQTREAQEALHQAIINLRVKQSLPHPDWVGAVAFSPDGKLLVTGSDDGFARVWNVDTGQEIFSLSGHTNWINAVDFSPDGRLIATASSDETVKIWDVETQNDLITLVNHSDSVHRVIFSPDGNLLVSGGMDGTVWVWDVLTGQEIITFSDFANDEINSLAFSPDGTRLGITTPDELTIWDLSSGENLLTISEDRVGGFDFSPDGKQLVVGIAEKVLLLNAETGQELLQLVGHTNWIPYVRFSPDGKQIASFSFDNTVRIWDSSSGQELLVLAQVEDIWNVKFSADGILVATGGDKIARIWDISPGGNKELLTLNGRKFRSVNFSPDDKLIITASQDGVVQIWDAESGRELLHLDAHEDMVHQAIFSPDGTRIATSSADYTAKIWDSETGQQLLSIAGHNEGYTGAFYGVMDVVFSPDGRRIATAGSDGVAKIWDAYTGDEILTLSGSEIGALTRIRFSPDGRLIATGHSRWIDDSAFSTEARIWDANTGEELHVLTVPGQLLLWGIAFDPAGERLITAGNFGVVKIWDVETGKELMDIPDFEGTSLNVSFSPDGSRVGIAGGDGLHIWDLEENQKLLELHSHSSMVTGLSFTKDWSLVATSSADGTVQVIYLNVDDLIILAESRLTRSLTTAECQQYLHLDTCPPAP